MSHFQATAFLSHIFLIVDLAADEGLSSAQIAKLLAEIDPRVGFSRQSIATALQAVKLEPGLELKNVQRLFTRDQNSELKAFADADLATAIQLVSDKASRLGFEGNMEMALTDLLRVNISAGQEETFAYVPYLQILHYQCVIADAFDHAITDLYEFAPRGRAALWLFDQYPPALATAGNPFLNNAKSVERIDESWARSKKPSELPGASALVFVLSGMEVMSFAARRELARWVRLLLHRLMRLKELLADPIPAVLASPEIKSILDAVATGNTCTFGILEQRVLDALVSGKHLQAAGWRGRGLKDSVNATNLSQRKLGDIDFQHAASLEIVAYEAHGGELSTVYIDEHVRTLRKVFKRRKEELIGIAELDRWKIRIVFVAHKLADHPRPLEIIDGVKIELSAVTFRDFFATCPPPGALEAEFEEYVRLPLSAKRMPHEVRQVVNSLLQPALAI
ncbi:hypothetical protein A9975_28565 [Cupriavidus sp. UME77]|nr:hypothetical protein [Cupriavidus sp. UME77]